MKGSGGVHAHLMSARCRRRKGGTSETRSWKAWRKLPILHPLQHTAHTGGRESTALVACACSPPEFRFRSLLVTSGQENQFKGSHVGAALLLEPGGQAGGEGHAVPGGGGPLGGPVHPCHGSRPRAQHQVGQARGGGRRGSALPHRGSGCGGGRDYAGLAAGRQPPAALLGLCAGRLLHIQVGMGCRVATAGAAREVLGSGGDHACVGRARRSKTPAA